MKTRVGPRTSIRTRRRGRRPRKQVAGGAPARVIVAVLVLPVQLGRHVLADAAAQQLDGAQPGGQAETVRAHRELDRQRQRQHGDERVGVLERGRGHGPARPDRAAGAGPPGAPPGPPGPPRACAGGTGRGGPRPRSAGRRARRRRRSRAPVAAGRRSADRRPGTGAGGRPAHGGRQSSSCSAISRVATAAASMDASRGSVGLTGTVRRAGRRARAASDVASRGPHVHRRAWRRRTGRGRWCRARGRRRRAAPRSPTRRRPTSGRTAASCGRARGSTSGARRRRSGTASSARPASTSM